MDVNVLKYYLLTVLTQRFVPCLQRERNLERDAMLKVYSSKGPNVIPRRARPGLAGLAGLAGLTGLRPHMLPMPAERVGC